MPRIIIIAVLCPLLYGTAFAADIAMTGLGKKVVTGRYLQSSDRGVLLAEDLAKYLMVSLGDEVVLLGSGYHGASAAGKYNVLGIVRFASPGLNVETVMIAVLGVTLGVVGALPPILYFHHNPIMLTGKAAEATLRFGYEPILPFSIEPSIFISQASSLVIISLVVSLCPLWIIAKTDIVSAIKT